MRFLIVLRPMTNDLAEIEPIFAAVGGTSILDVERFGEAVSVGLQTGTSPRSRNAKKTAA
jgi:hypothetical protein